MISRTAYYTNTNIKRKTEVIKPIYKYLSPRKWYNDLFDKIVEEGATRWEERSRNLAYNPSEKQLQELTKLLRERKPDITEQEIKESNTNLMMLFSILLKQGYREMENKKRKKEIKAWRDRDRDKDERVLNTKPIKNVICPVCNSKMKYKFSQLHDRGTLKKPDEQVMFFYECPQKCKRKFIFEDGTPWISKEKNLCPVCSTERNTTVTKDNQDKMYFIYECPKCGSRQVEKETD